MNAFQQYEGEEGEEGKVTVTGFHSGRDLRCEFCAG